MHRPGRPRATRANLMSTFGFSRAGEVMPDVLSCAGDGVAKPSPVPILSPRTPEIPEQASESLMRRAAIATQWRNDASHVPAPPGWPAGGTTVEIPRPLSGFLV